MRPQDVGIQLPLFPAGKVGWVAPTDFPRLPETGRVGIDTETRDPDLERLGPGWMRPDFAVVGWSIAVEGGPSLYVPVGHAGGENVADREAAWRWLRDWAATFRGDLVGLNLQYDLLALATRGVEFGEFTRFMDVGVADVLIDERHASYSLAAVAARWNVLGKDEDELIRAAAAYGVDPKGGLWKLPAGHIAAYATRDAEAPLEILRRQEEAMHHQGLGPVWELERRVTPALVAMSRRGLRVDDARLDEAAAWVERRIAERLETIRQLTGVQLSAGSPADPKGDLDKKARLGPMFEAAGIDMPRIESGPRAGEIEVQKAYLESLGHPVARALLEAREANTLRKTFVRGIRAAMANGRVHCTFRQLRGDRYQRRGADGSGGQGGTMARLSATNPNLQNQARRHDGGKVFRRVFVPDEGKQLGEADYAAQEVRLMVHFAVLADCIGADEARDQFVANPDHNLFRAIADAQGLDYQRTKNACYAKSYGAGVAKIATTAGIPEAEVQHLLDRVHEAAPFLKYLQYAVKDAANERGFVRTLMGRRLRFPAVEWHFDPWGRVVKHDFTHKALNYLIQGSAADQSKLALAICHEAGIPVQLQVHDSLTLSIRERSEIARVAEIMRDCVSLEVPVHVETKVGPSWGELK